MIIEMTHDNEIIRILSHGKEVTDYTIEYVVLSKVKALYSEKATEVMECVQQNINGQAFVSWLHEELGLGDDE
jgi:hypothetical protein